MDTKEPAAGREFGYHAQVSWGQWVVFGYLSVITLLSMVDGFWAWERAGTMSLDFLLAALRTLGFALLAGGFFALYRSLATFKLVVEEDGFHYSNFRASGFIRWQDITSVRPRYIPYTGGWLTIRTADTTLRLTVVLKEIDAFTRVVYQHLRDLDTPPFSRVRLFGFYRTASCSTIGFYQFKHGRARWVLAWLTAAAITGALLGIFPLAMHPAWQLCLFLIIGVAVPSLFFWGAFTWIIRRWIRTHADEAAFEIPAPTTAQHQQMRSEILVSMVVASALFNALSFAGLLLGGF